MVDHQWQKRKYSGISFYCNQLAIYPLAVQFLPAFLGIRLAKQNLTS